MRPWWIHRSILPWPCCQDGLDLLGRRGDLPRIGLGRPRFRISLDDRALQVAQRIAQIDTGARRDLLRHRQRRCETLLVPAIDIVVEIVARPGLPQRADLLGEPANPGAQRLPHGADGSNGMAAGSRNALSESVAASGEPVSGAARAAIKSGSSVGRAASRRNAGWRTSSGVNRSVYPAHFHSGSASVSFAKPE